MKPQCLCFVYTSSKGIDLVRCYPEPDILKKREINKVIKKSIPYTAEGGEFVTYNYKDFTIVSYVFTLNVFLQKRLAAFVVFIKEEEYNAEEIKNHFDEVLIKLENENWLDFENIANNLPDIYRDLIHSKFIEFKVNSSVSIEIDLPKKEKPKNKVDDSEVLDGDLWAEDEVDEIEKDDTDYIDIIIEDGSDEN